jgi:hypothetical protein
MNSAVELAERIKLNSTTSPLDFLITLSNILSQQGVGTVHIDKIEWQAININEKNKKEDEANFTAKHPVKHGAVITGRIIESEHNYRESVDRIQAIINALNISPRIEYVEPLKMPVDLRSESKFSTASGVNIKQQGNRDSFGIFSLKIIMKAPDHA